MSHCAFLCSLLHVLKIDVDKLEEQVKEKEKKVNINRSENPNIFAHNSYRCIRERSNGMDFLCTLEKED